MLNKLGRKILVIGCPGSGKSTLSRVLHQATGIALFPLDRMYWNADKTVVERSVFLDRLREVLSKDAWIIDGNYLRTLPMRLLACDTVFYFDLPAEECIRGALARIGKKREDMPWIEEELDPEFRQ